MTSDVFKQISFAALLTWGQALPLAAQTRPPQPARPPAAAPPAKPAIPRCRPDVVEDAQTPQRSPASRPEQIKTDHDRADFSQAQPSSGAFADQPKAGKLTGFDFSRDPLGAAKPFQSFQETFEQENAARPQVMAAQRQLLASRYDLTPHSTKPQ